MIGNDAELGHRISCQGLFKIFGDNPEALMESLNPEETGEEFLVRTGAVAAVRDVSFDVRIGETFVIMGLSGSGKSTLVRCLDRLIEPTAGKIFVDGEDLLQMNKEELREIRRHKMSMVFQHFGNFTHKKVVDNVAYGLKVQGVDPTTRASRASEVIDLVGLTGWEQRYPSELSGGMQQRVGLARALAVDPEILLFDEPFSALDPLIRRDMQDELVRLQETVQKTIIFITHDFMEAIKIGDRIAIMKDGEFIQVGTPEDLVANPIDDYVKDFTSDVPRSKVLTAKSIMAYPELVISATLDPREAIIAMDNRDVGSAIVVDEQSRFLGTISVDGLKSINGHASEVSGVSELVNGSCPTVSPNATLEEIVRLSTTSGTSLVVLNKDKRLLGTIDQTTAVTSLLGEGV